MDVEESFNIAGKFGKYQILVTLTNFLTNIIFGSQMLLMVIVGATPDKTNPDEANLKTIVTEWNLYDNKWIVDLMTSLFMAGFIAGCVIFGQLPDLYGRKPVLLINYTIGTICCFCSAFCTNWQTFAVTRFLSGMFCGGAAPPAFVLLCELIGRNMWASIGMIYQIYFSLGVIQLGLFGMLLQDWRKVVMLVSGLAMGLVPPLFFIVPESPRWLYSVGKLQKAEQVMKKIARKNGKDDSCIVLAENTTESSSGEYLRKYNFIDMVRIESLAMRLLMSSYVWFACALSYYGLTLDAADLSPNLYFDIMLSGSVEIPAYIITILLMDRRWMGRRGTALILLLISSMSSVGIIFIAGEENSTARIVFGLISKLTIAGAFSLLYIYISELFPTQLRGVALGVTIVFARIGSVVAPFVPLLASAGAMIPYAVFGAGTLIAGAMTLVLPETLGRRLVSISEFLKNHRAEPVNAADSAVDDQCVSDGRTNDKEVLIRA